MRRDCRRSGARRAARPQPESAASPLLDCAAVRTGPNGGNEMPGFLQTHNITYRRQMQACLHISIRPARRVCHPSHPRAFAARPALLPPRAALLPSVPPDARLSPAQPRAALLPPIPPCCPSLPARFAAQPHAALLPPRPPSCPSSPARFCRPPGAFALRPTRARLPPARRFCHPSRPRFCRPARRFSHPFPPSARLPPTRRFCRPAWNFSRPDRRAFCTRPARTFAAHPALLPSARRFWLHEKNAGAKYALLRRGGGDTRNRTGE